MEEQDKVVYMLLNCGDYEARDMGPYWGARGLDFNALASQYRAAAYAAAEAQGEDHCWLTDSAFAAWLIDTGVLSPAGSVHVSFTLENYGEHRYIPGHWPACPRCDEGRGEPDYRNVRADLNRVEMFAKCTHCGHEWDGHDVPNASNRAMLVDDGRYTRGGCVPYAISQCTGLSFASVLTVCGNHGWVEGGGMSMPAAVQAAALLGFELAPRGHGPRVTLTQLLRSLSPSRRYIISTGDHCLAVVQGENRDRADTHGRKIVHGCWEVLPLAVQVGRAA